MSALTPDPHLLDVLAAMPDGAPCSCWTAPPGGLWIHGGHCCFDGPTDAYAPDRPTPCGHVQGPRNEGESR